MRQLYRLLLASTVVLALSAQQPSFRVFTTQDGLVRNWITKIRRDSRGFLWFCTAEGISLFDGYRFTNFSTQDGLPSRLVLDMVETRQGEHWFATSRGLAHFREKHGKGPAFQVLRVGASNESNEIHALHEGPDGTLWCATAAGLYSFKPGGGDNSPRFTPLGASDPPEVTALAEDSRGNLWVATWDRLFRRRPTGEIDSPVPVAQGLGAMVIDNHNRLWAGGYGLIGIDTSMEPPKPLPQAIVRTSGALVSALYKDDGGEIWVGMSTGLVRFRPDASPPDARFYAASDNFPIDHIGAIEQDARHNLWLAAGTLGAVRIAAGSFDLFTKADGLESAEVLGMVESLRGTLYAVTGQWTLNEFNNSRFIALPLRQPRPGLTWAIGRTLVQDDEDRWWAATGEGVIRYPAGDARELKGKLPDRLFTVRDGLPSRVVLRMFRDSHGDIWAGTDDGVGHWSRATGRWQAHRTADLIPGSTRSAAVHSFAEDRSGDVWAGMYPSGLIRFHAGVAKLFTREVPAGAINSLLADHLGGLWIGSSQGGVGRMENPSSEEPHIRRYSLQQGLSSEHVFSLAEDNEGRVYVAGGHGVDRLDPATAAVRHFTASNGLPPGETQFLFRDREGSIWFASFYGLSRYRPETDQVSDTPAPLLRSVSVGGARYPISEFGEQQLTGVALAPGHDSLEVEFRALHFDIGEGLRYQYRMEGANSNWSEPSDAQTVRYAGLGPGSYSFTVRSITESGRVSAGQATLTFRVLPVFWRRTWFLALAALAIAATFVTFHRYRLNHALALERVRTRLATDLHDDLGAGLAEIAILSEVAKREAQPRMIGFLDGIAERARLLRVAMTDIVWTVDPREDFLADLVLRMRQVAFTMLETEERSVEFLAPPAEHLDIKLAPTVRRHMLLFFKEAITNALRHAGATAVRVEIESVSGRFRMLIRDNGCGFDPKQAHSGRGLRGLRYRAGELRGQCQVRSVVATGTEIELNLRL